MKLLLLFTISLATPLIAQTTPPPTGLCPILGPVFPPAKSLSTSPSLASALEALKSQLSTAFETGQSPHGALSANDTYSIQIFSANDKDLLFNYHHRGSNLADTNAEINGDSVYRIGSISKLITVYLLLLQAGDGIFNEPITRFIPEWKGQGIWDEVTVGALAGQIAGVDANLYSVDSVSGGGLGKAFPEAFPQLAQNETSPCDANVTFCDRAQVLDAWKVRGQAYLPNSTPAYSNSAFILLGFVIEALTGKTYEEALQSLVVSPLKLRNTTSLIPKSTVGGVILGNPTNSGWDIDIRTAGAMGSIFASSNDLSAVGRSILSSAFLHPNTTRAWLKPTSFTSSLIGGVGRPWEIYRASLDAENNRVVDIYTKGGNVGVYASLLALAPDLGVGFTVQAASERGNGNTMAVGDMVSKFLLSAVEEAGRVEAHAAYAGTYRAKSGLNSTVTLTTTAGKPGLKIQQWISNGTDMFTIFRPPGEYRVYPTNIVDKDGKWVSWRAISGFDIGVRGNGPFSSCPTWLGVDRPQWGIWGIDEFLFHLKEGGEAKSLQLKAFKVILEKE